MKLNKWIIIAIAIIIIVGGILIFTPLLDIIGFTDPGLCSENPYNKDCTCPETYEKLEYNQGASWSISRYFCESEDKYINIDSSGWEDDAISKGQSKLSDAFPDCDMSSCNKGDAEWVITAGPVTGSGVETVERWVNLECYDEYQSTYFASISMEVGNGDIHYAYCNDYFEKEEETSTYSIIYKGPWSINGVDSSWQEFKYKADCNGPALISEEYVYESTIPVPIKNWFIHGEGDTDLDDWTGPGCRLINENSYDVTIKCNYECTGFSNSGGDLLLLRYNVENPYEDGTCGGENGIYKKVTYAVYEDGSKQVKSFSTYSGYSKSFGTIPKDYIDKIVELDVIENELICPADCG